MRILLEMERSEKRGIGYRSTRGVSRYGTQGVCAGKQSYAPLPTEANYKE